MPQRGRASITATQGRDRSRLGDRVGIGEEDVLAGGRGDRRG